MREKSEEQKNDEKFNSNGEEKLLCAFLHN